MSHLKRISSSKRTSLERKGTTFLTCQSPGTHKKGESMALNVVMRDILGVVDTTREAKKALHSEMVLVNGVAKKDHRLSVGFLDEITFTSSKDTYTMVYNTLGKLEVRKQENKLTRAMKIIGKKTLAKGKIQLNLFTGKNIILDKKADYSVGDSVVVDKEKVTKHLKFEKGAKVFLISGKHIGYNGVIEEIKKTESWSQSKKIIIKTKNGTFETSKECAYVMDGEL
ncbi:hypothetical protein HOB91_00885 [Candidatus Woesearchaeota archaeon]|nr:hypothetical protein [Candidatus Woesearchaeota archaeon]